MMPRGKGGSLARSSRLTLMLFSEFARYSSSLAQLQEPGNTDAARIPSLDLCDKSWRACAPQEPSTEGAEVGEISAEQTVEVVGACDDWMRLAGDDERWVLARKGDITLIDLVASARPRPSLMPAGPLARLVPPRRDCPTLGRLFGRGVGRVCSNLLVTGLQGWKVSALSGATVGSALSGWGWGRAAATAKESTEAAAEPSAAASANGGGGWGFGGLAKGFSSAVAAKLSETASSVSANILAAGADAEDVEGGKEKDGGEEKSIGEKMTENLEKTFDKDMQIDEAGLSSVR